MIWRVYRLTLAIALAGVFPGLARADIRAVSAKDEVARLPVAAAHLYADTTLCPRPTRWRNGIPWLVDLDQAIRQAKKEKRPILIWVSGDEPLERC